MYKLIEVHGRRLTAMTFCQDIIRNGRDVGEWIASMILPCGKTNVYHFHSYVLLSDVQFSIKTCTMYFRCLYV